eukprot:gene2191-2694_t
MPYIPIPNNKVFSQKNLENGKQIIVKNGDITKEIGPDIIVNPSNDNLKHIGGCAYAISKAAGKGFDNECLEFVSKNGKLNVGQSLLTRPHNMKHLGIGIICTVGPFYNSIFKNDCQEQLKQTILCCLGLANMNGCRTIALPVISSGAFGFPISQASKISIDTANDYFKKNQDTSIVSIIFIDYDISHARELEKHLNGSVNQNIIQIVLASYLL